MKKRMILDVVLIIASLFLMIWAILELTVFKQTNWVFWLEIMVSMLWILLFLTEYVELDKKNKQICKKCGNKFNLTTKQVLLSMHIGFTKYCKCPECNERHWNKKEFIKLED
jgi:c-di-AMP phosphodiesterase-like protein